MHYSMSLKIFLEFIFCVIFSCFLAILFTYPSIHILDTKFIGDSGDTYEQAGYGALLAKRIQNGEFPLSNSTYWRYPVGFEVARGFDSYISITLATLSTLFLGIPRGYNVSIFIILVLNGILSFYAFRFLFRSTLLGLLGLTVYGFSFYTLAKSASHMNLLFVGGIPLLTVSIVRIMLKEKVKLRDIFFFFGSLFLILLGSGQYFLISVLFIFLYGTALFLANKQLAQSMKKKIANSLSSWVIGITSFLVLGGIFYFPYIKSFVTGTFFIVHREGALFALTPSITDFLSPNTFVSTLASTIATSTSNTSIEKVLFIGWIELALIAAFFIQNISRRTKMILGVGMLIPFVFMLGYGRDNSFFLLPYRYIFPIFPFTLIAEPGRYFIVFYFVATLAILKFLASIENKKQKVLAILIVFCLVILERIPLSFKSTDSLKNETYISVVKKQPSRAVLDLPIDLTYSPYNILSLYYEKPIVNGYFHWSANTPKEEAFITKDKNLVRYICSETDSALTYGNYYALEDQKDRELLEMLKKHDIRTIVVHKDYKFYHSVCKNVRIRLSRLAPFISELQTTPLTEEKRIDAKVLSGKPSFSLSMPYDGTFFLDGLYIGLTNPASFFVTHNGLTPDFQYGWSVQDDGKSIEITPKYSLSTKVNAGDMVTIQSFDDVDTSWFSLWYRYTKEATSSAIPFQSTLKKIYDDEKATVYQVN